MRYGTRICSPVGGLTLVAQAQALTMVIHENCRFQPQLEDVLFLQPEAHPVLSAAADWLERYFAGSRPAISELSMAPKGTPFQLEVWQLLRKIPYGETTTYGALARELARQRGIPRMSAQAVGNAVGRNPLSIIVPCHRVIGADGSLVGFGSGLDVKAQLLLHEGCVL